MNARDKLETLEDLFLVDREKNRDAKRGPYRYYITDPAVDFWYRFVQPNRSRLEMEAFDDIWENEISPSLNTYVGKVFERVCRQGYGHFSDDWGLPGIASWGRWEGQDRNQQSIEIDIVAELTDGSMLLGEIKWSSSPVEASLHFDLQNDLERLAESGRGWAGQALQEETSNYIYFSAGGFSDSFQERSNNDEAIHLKTLNDLF